MKPTVLFLGKRDDLFCDEAERFARSCFDTTVVRLRRGEAIPTEIAEWTGDYIVSYLFPRLVPAALLGKAGKAAINFHPGPPEYPGIGCTNFALYDGAKSFGVTCHHMNPTADSGQIIRVSRFPLLETDDVLILTRRCYAYILPLFYDIMTAVLLTGELPVSDEQWQRVAYTRRELEAMCEIDSSMSSEEVARRVRAVTFPNMPGAYIDVHGFRFKFTADGRAYPERGSS